MEKQAKVQAVCLIADITADNLTMDIATDNLVDAKCSDKNEN